MTGADRLIAASIDRVATAVADVEAYPSWASDVSAATVLQRDATGAPRRARLTFAAGALRDEVVLDYAVTRRSGAFTMTWNLVSAQHLKALRGSYELTERGVAGTHVRYLLDVDPGIALHTALRTKMQTRIIEAALDALERRATADPLG